MNLQILDKSPHLANVLMKLYDKDHLKDLLSSDIDVSKSKFSDNITELFKKDLAPHETEVLSEFILTLIKEAEREMRIKLSSRIAEIDEAPLSLILNLANADIDIASPILEHSTVLSDMDLIYIVKAQGSDYWEAIAKREHLGAQTIDALVDTKHEITAVTLSQNDRVVLTSHALQVFEKLVRESDDLAGALIKRHDIPQGFVAKIYKHVSDELKTYIQEHNKGALPELDFIAEDVALDFTEATKKPQDAPSSKIIKAVRNEKHMRGPTTVDSLMAILTKGDIETFTAMFADLTGLSVRRVHDFIRETCPKGFAIACRAFEIQKSDFSRIYLLTNRLRSPSGIVNHKHMVEILNYYDTVRTDTARKIVGRSISKSSTAEQVN